MSLVRPRLRGGCAKVTNKVLYCSDFCLLNGEMAENVGLRGALPMFVVGYAVTFICFRHMTSLPDCTDEMLALFFTYCSLNVPMMTEPLFFCQGWLV